MLDFVRRWFGRGGEEPSSAGIPPADEAEVRIIRACRERFGSAPRALEGPDLKACRLDLNPYLASWLKQAQDPLLEVLRDQPVLLKRGQVVWGHLVQANQMLFDPANRRTLPADIIYSSDPFFDGRVARLAEFAHGLLAQKGSVPEDHELRYFVHAITNEHERVMRRELPRRYCCGRSVYFNTCLIQPGHFPMNYLCGSSFPVIVNGRKTRAVMVLPSRFWPSELVARWEARATEAPPQPHPAEFGGEPLLALTPAAAAQIRGHLGGNGTQYLRVAWEVVEVKNGVPASLRQTVSVATEKGPDDVVFESGGVTIVIDSMSAKFFRKGEEVLDWVAGADGRMGFVFRSTKGK